MDEQKQNERERVNQFRERALALFSEYPELSIAMGILTDGSDGPMRATVVSSCCEVHGLSVVVNTRSCG